MRLKSLLNDLYFSHEPSFLKNIFITKNGRSAIYLFLKSLNLPKDSEIIVQAFTCNSVVNPILWLGLKPVYADISRDNLSIDLESLKKNISERSRVVILQHTFGIPANSEEVIRFCKQKNILVLEDCAHALGVRVKGAVLGRQGDASIVSFGLEKTLSTKVGGALLVNNSTLIEPINTEYGKWRYMSYAETFVWLLNPVIRVALRRLPLFQVSFAALLSRLGIFNTGFVESELKGEMPRTAWKLLPGVLASIIVERLVGMEYNLAHRENINCLYNKNLSKEGFELVASSHGDGLPLIKFPLLVPGSLVRDQLRAHLRSKRIYISDWYDPVIYPSGTDLDSMGYLEGSCPTAEDISKRIINLPTGSYVTTAHAKMICNEIKAFINSR